MGTYTDDFSVFAFDGHKGKHSCIRIDSPKSKETKKKLNHAPSKNTPDRTEPKDEKLLPLI